jgi:membrane associated rhomboid family serine protease
LIPLRDTEPIQRMPWVTWLLIAASAAVFVLESRLPETELDQLIRSYAVHPSWYGEHGPAGLFEFPRQLLLPLFTSLFLHGGLLHLVGNMWMLWIFGDNVEDRLGPLRYALFYAAAGALASGVHIVTNSASSVPTIGASGAIAAVMGAYFVLFPRAKVVVLVPLVVIPLFIKIPAVVFLGLWFLLQFAQGALSSGLSGGVDGHAGGIAWWAHVGGFLGGIALLALLGGRRDPRIGTRREST